MEELRLIRPLEEQFEPGKCAEIRDLIAKFSALPFEGGACRYFTLEVTGCLEAGLLLAAVSVTSVLLETFFRELLIIHRLQSAGPKTNRWGDTLLLLNKFEKETEDGRPRLHFDKIVDQLTGDVLDSAEAEAAKKFYKDIRVPIHHGLTRRLIAKAKAEEVDMSDPWNVLLATMRESRLHMLDKVIEENATKYLGFVVDLIQKYTK